MGNIPNRNKIKPVIYDFIKWYHENIAINELAPLINYHLLIKYYEDKTGNKVSYTSVKRYIDEFRVVNGHVYSKIDGYELLPNGQLIKKSDNDDDQPIDN